ncbi:hypothetical protein DAPPUDRAFT_276467 [Daphnia pulex]|uniref:Protein kinase domain-containing protein n=1 Tax=Daphnia pulex TaxID=6669 RepID=E9I5V1_DAPPU|nr:hypothetical protein DAPPUDRAFT_276467 [Daphnia pulex]|eukprot:EFX60628.1 hypothetical protein DAPPUDRAFT_276467 [Daphnia pulex]
MKLADFGLCQGIAADGTLTTKPTIHSAELNDIIERDKNSELDPVTATGGNKEELSHSKFWKRPEIIGSLTRSVSSSGSSRSVESTVPINKDISYSIPGATAEGDTFAAGCLFFYFIKRGLHPFGDAHSILNNIQEWKPVNVKELDEHHFAYKPILDLIGNSSIEGSQQFLIEAALKFRVGAFAVAWKMNMLKK